MRPITTITLLLCFILGCLQQDTAKVETYAPPVGAASTPSDTVSVDAGAGEPSAKEFVIDVRTKAEWDTGHVAKAVLIPHTEIADRIGEVTKDKDARIVLYCRSGGRSGRAKAALEELGFTNVENAGSYEDIKDRYVD